MNCNNLPVQVILHCDAKGELRPLRFQFTDASGRQCVVHVSEITDIRTVEFSGNEAMLYLCRSSESLYELKYLVQSHKWVLFRKIY